ncbi:MAG TPA: efflux RND transporter periplasmic adaptor subunit [Polyangiaceae bacterium]|jgi:RND family efflux transporter MFP subunit
MGVPIVIVAGVLLVATIGAALIHRSESKVNHVALSSTAKPVTVVAAEGTSFRESRVYVGTLRPWIEAQVGPQFISAYVDTVLVRPGAFVKRGEVLATLDCRNASASNQAVAAEARAIDARQHAVADESARLKTMLDGGFVSPNEAEMKEAQSASELAQLASQRAKMMGTNLEVNDCILRSPFEGEIATRTIDPGAFVRPGTAIVSVVDRTTVRMTFDAPEGDFSTIAPGASLTVHVLATGETIAGTIARRSPSADPDTRTVHCEVDLSDPTRHIPVNTTGEVRIQIGNPRPCTAIPLDAASISGSKAGVFVVEGGRAHKAMYRVEGELGGAVFLDRSLAAGTPVVSEGRAILADGDAVTTKQVPFIAAAATAPTPAKEPSP